MLDLVETVASCSVSIAVQTRPAEFDELVFQEWDFYKKALDAIDSLKNLDPIPEKLRKLKPKDLP